MRAVAELRALAADRARVTLLYGAKDPRVNHARVLAGAWVTRVPGTGYLTDPGTRVS